MKENSEEDIKNIEEIIELSKEEIDAKDENITAILDIEDLISLEHILSDYKRVLKENEVYKKNSEIMSKENLSTAEQLKVEIKENFRLKNQLENNRKEYQETYKDVREELKELRKENKEVKENCKKCIIRDELDEYVNNSISIQKVKDKIRKNEEIIDISNDGDLIHELYQENKVYEELLESEE